MIHLSLHIAWLSAGFGFGLLVWSIVFVLRWLLRCFSFVASSAE